MSAAILLHEVQGRGVELFLEQGRLRYRCRPGTLTPTLRQMITAHKPELIELLSQPKSIPPSAPKPSSSSTQRRRGNRREAPRISALYWLARRRWPCPAGYAATDEASSRAWVSTADDDAVRTVARVAADVPLQQYDGPRGEP